MGAPETDLIGVMGLAAARPLRTVAERADAFLAAFCTGSNSDVAFAASELWEALDQVELPNRRRPRVGS